MGKISYCADETVKMECGKGSTFIILAQNEHCRTLLIQLDADVVYVLIRLFIIC